MVKPSNFYTVAEGIMISVRSLQRSEGYVSGSLAESVSDSQGTRQ